ncbi:hypothetical protein F4809DRAFT_664792 [Biscogniauxia mediterranea]|nr:hypothetical protein F4809DRAFT_664792 [Biscogniauxia mediterranea]
MSQLHVKLVDDILALSKAEDKDQELVRKYFSDIATLADETALARRVLSSVAAFLESRSSLSDLQSRVIIKILEELSDEQDAARPSPATVKGTELRDYISQDVVYHFTMPSSMANDELSTGDDDPAENASRFSGVEPGMRVSPLTLPGKKAGSFSSSEDSSVISANEVYGNALNKSKQQDPVSKDSQELKKVYPFGHKLMSSYGWTPNQGLGPDGDGIKQPVPGDSAQTLKRYDSNPGVGHASGETSNAPGKQPESFPDRERDMMRSQNINKPKTSRWYKPDKRKHHTKREWKKRPEPPCEGNPLPDTAPQGEKDADKPDLFDRSVFYPKGVNWAACEPNYTRDEWRGGRK